MKRLCEYGCGQVAKYKLKFSTTERWCCSKFYQSCPSNKNIPWNKGKTNIYSKESLLKMSRVRKGKHNSEETRNKISQKTKGKKKSEEHKKRISLSLVGKRKSEEHKKKISISQKGKPRKKHTKETKLLQRQNQLGTKNTFFGNHHSDKSKKKISRPGSANPNWKGGIACEPYCQVWGDQEYKESIKERDSYRCLNPLCNHECKYLCLHHIDYNKKNCTPLNLITLCKSCNSKANFDRPWYTSWYQRNQTDRLNGLIIGTSLVTDLDG
jgi:hypothetical protein